MNESLGKTLAYVIPIIHQIQIMEPLVRRETGPIAIVLVPTKEVKTLKF
jgi:superfamily II DNA/RNA helicase